MRVKVMKFGGTSVATAEARSAAARRVVSAIERGYSPLVVVSAIGRKGQPYATDTLIGLLREIDPVVEPDAREQDLMIACGEIFSAVIFAHTLKTLGQRAQAFRGGQAGIRTDGVYGNARIVSIKPVTLQKTLEQGIVPVVCGFQGVYVAGDGSPGGELTTLGRGGSDTTAAALGAALGAEAVEIYTDVDGFKTADPVFVPEAFTLRQVSYDEVAESAHLGAKVVHPRAAEIAMKFGIPLRILNTFSDDHGTEVVELARAPNRAMTGITHSGKLVYMLHSTGHLDAVSRRDVESAVCRVLAGAGVNLFTVNLNPSGFGFAVPRRQFPDVERLLDGLVIPRKTCEPLVLQVGAAPSRACSMQAELLGVAPSSFVSAELSDSCTIVSVVGRDLLNRPGVFYEVLRSLSEAAIPVLQTSDSELSLSCLIPESEAHRAVKLLHEKFVTVGSTEPE